MCLKSYIYKILTLCFLFLSIVCFGANENKNNREAKRHDNIRQAVSYMALYERYRINAPFDAIDYAKKALEIYERYGHVDQIKALNSIGNIYFENKIYLLALDSYYKSLRAAEDFKDQSAIGYCYSDIGNINFHQGNYEVAHDFYQKAIVIFKKIEEQEGVAVSSNNIGLVFQEQKNYDKALEYFFMSLNIRKDNHTAGRIAHSYSLISDCYLRQNMIKLSLNYLDKSIELYQDDKDDKMLAEMYYTKSTILYNEKVLAESMKYAEEALKLFTGIKHNNFITKCHILLSQIYFRSNNFTKAHSEALISQKHAYASKDFSLTMDVYNQLSEIEIKRGNYRKALDYLKYYITYKDSLTTNTNNSKISNLKLSILTFNKEKENELLKKDVGYNKRIRNFFFIGLIIFFVLAAMLFYQIVQKIKANRKLRESKQRETKLLNLELETRNRELASKTINRLKRESAIKKVIEEMKQLRLSKVSNQKLVNTYVNELEKVIHDNIWDEFRIRFEKVHKDFYTKITEKHPNLSQTDLKLAAFLRLNMSTKEIASITNKELSSIDVARSRLRKKLNLSREDNLVGYLSEV